MIAEWHSCSAGTCQQGVEKVSSEAQADRAKDHAIATAVSPIVMATVTSPDIATAQVVKNAHISIQQVDHRHIAFPFVKEKYTTLPFTTIRHRNYIV